MNHNITDDAIEYVGILAKLSLTEAQKETAGKDMAEMLTYIDKMNELDTDGVEPAAQTYGAQNVFREDVVCNGDDSSEILKNAPGLRGNLFQAPCTILRQEGL